MEIILQESIKIPDSVVIAGLTHTDRDKEVEAYLEKFGSVNRIFSIDTTEFPKHVIVEFTHGTAMQSLAPLLHLSFASSTTPEVTYKLSSLASIYNPLACSNATKTYLKELQAIAKLSAKPFELLLQEELGKFAASLPSEKTPEATSDPHKDQVPFTIKEIVDKDPIKASPGNVPLTPCGKQSLSPTSAFASYLAPPATVKRHPLLSDEEMINPPEIQKVVVEHIVKTDSVVSHLHGSSRLRVFSGKTVRPSNEVDYETWRTNVDLFLTDPSVSDLDRSRKIFDSLLPPAADIVKHLGPQALPNAYLELLNSAYGTVADGDECFAKFLSTFQNHGEKPSEYLHRLQVVLNTAVKRGGVLFTDLNRHLLKQFCRGCWDNALISDLQLEKKKDSPPSFAELLLLLRVEEDKQVAKASRMKHHLGSSRPTSQAVKSPAVSHVHSTCSCTVVEQSSELAQLKKMVTQLQKQLSVLTSSFGACSTSSPMSQTKSTDTVTIRKKTGHTGKQFKASSKPSSPLRPGYCFNCGEDGHISSHCDQPSNPSLVAFKKAQLQEKRRHLKFPPSPDELN